MAIPNPISEKNALRTRIRRLLRENQPDVSTVNAALQNWIKDHPALQTIAVYSPLPGEVDLSQTISAFPTLRWVYPRVFGEHLSFHTGEDLTPGSFGILEPSESAVEVPVDEIDAFICPGLAFDKRGGRLGRGRGFYDRMLARSRPDSLKVGVCHDFQMVDDTFSEPHDFFMDAVITN